MSGASFGAGEWSTLLELPHRPELLSERPDDPRLAETIQFWDGDPSALRAGRPVLVGFPQDVGVRRNRGRPGAAEAPRELRLHLWRLTNFDAQQDCSLAANSLLDLGDVRVDQDLEASQCSLARVVGAALAAGAIPIVLGGGHETAYGHYLGYVLAQQPVGIINLDAHLDVRPCLADGGHSGSPFRQAMEHPTQPLAGANYVCLGAQPHAVSREHLRQVCSAGGVVRWCGEVRNNLRHHLEEQIRRLGSMAPRIYLTIDADVVSAADVPGVSAPNADGLAGTEILAAARLAGRSRRVSSLDLVEVNPRFDHDGRSSRWGALAIWQFLAGLAERDDRDQGPDR